MIRRALLSVALGMATSALACVPEDYQQIKDEVEVNGRNQMVARYCSEFRLWKAALHAEADFSATRASRESARAERECRTTTLDRMRTALRIKDGENVPCPPE